MGIRIPNKIRFSLVKGRYSFLHWNGQKWSDEKIGDEFISDIITRKMVNDNYFCAVNSGIVDFSVLYRAYKKNKNISLL